MTRRELREHCFKMLFCADFYQAEEKEEQLKQYFQAPEEDETSPEGVNEILHRVELKEADEEVLLKRAEGIMVKVPELDEKIDEVAKGWKTRRMGKVELAILRLAVYEMKYDEEVPEKVAINEAVELAKKFGGSDAPAFVNGILAKLV
ncbi:MAG: transcription antitermination factor NusB [Lachnospiraceae bacterium]|jgi:N utilization substance protein B|nr:transcription antitermination factor NusB [Lachnospiraceae bacterium]MDE6929574.1 transcription antitermination factor NusB [Lachnospiraceae bacterium]